MDDEETYPLDTAYALNPSKTKHNLGAIQKVTERIFIAKLQREADNHHNDGQRVINHKIPIHKGRNKTHRIDLQEIYNASQSKTVRK